MFNCTSHAFGFDFHLIFVFCVSYLRFFSSLSTQFAPHFLHCFFAHIQTRFERWITRTCTNLSKTKVNFQTQFFYTLKTMSNHRISKIPKFILNFSLTENEHEISAMLDLPTSPTSPMDVMDLNPFRYFTGLVPKVSKSVQKVS